MKNKTLREENDTIKRRELLAPASLSTVFIKSSFMHKCWIVFRKATITYKHNIFHWLEFVYPFIKKDFPSVCVTCYLMTAISTIRFHFILLSNAVKVRSEALYLYFNYTTSFFTGCLRTKTEKFSLKVFTNKLVKLPFLKLCLKWKKLKAKIGLNFCSFEANTLMYQTLSINDKK